MKTMTGLFVLGMLGLALTATGCSEHRVAEMNYSPENPYAPGGPLYVSWEQQKRSEGIERDEVITHTAGGAAVGAVFGQAAGGDTEGTLTGTAIGAGVGLISGVLEDDKQRKAHEDHYRRLANNWEIEKQRRDQAISDVYTGAALGDDELTAQRARLKKAQQDLAERDANAQRAREYRQIEEEIERIENTVTSN